MIKGKSLEPINLGTIIEIDKEKSKLAQYSVMKEAFFKVGMRDEEWNIVDSHREPIIPSFMPPRGLELMGEIEANLRELWLIMCDDSQYYDRS